MVYNTADDVRKASGFDGNDDITDEVIEGHILDAYNVLLGYIGSVYDVTGFSGSNFTGSHAAGMLKRIEMLLASGNLLYDEFGPNQQGTNTDGELKIEKAMDLINDIMGTGKAVRVRLLGVDGTEFPLVGLTSTRAPISSTGFVGNTSKFSVNDQY